MPVHSKSSESSSVSQGALQGVRVLDLSHALAGPYCTMILSDYGATIYKLESREGGDMGRGWGPPFYGDQASFFMGLNRGKYGLCIDLKRPEGVELCLRLVEKMDVLIENFRPGTLQRLGLGYSVAAARNPGLIYCSISGYGQDGPARDEAAMDLIVQSAGGLMSVTGDERSGPVRCGYSVADVTAGLFAIIGILMALQARERTGRGQYVDVAMLDALISGMTSSYMIFLGSNELQPLMGSGYPTIVPYRVYRAKDRDFAIAVASERLWSAFCKGIGRPDLEHHPDFATNTLRVAHREALDRILSDLFREKPAAEWLSILRAVGTPCDLVRNLREVVNDPQCAHREMFPVIEHPHVGPHVVTGSPVKFSDTPGHPSRPAPLLGEHTRFVLADLLGLDDSTLTDLVERGVLFQAPDEKG